MKIYNLKLVNGDELIGKIISEDGLNITIEDPLTPEVIGENGNKILTSYLKYNTNGNKPRYCTIAKTNIIVMSKIHPTIEKYYLNSISYTREYDLNFLENIEKANEFAEQSKELSMRFPEENDEMDETLEALLDSPFFHTSNATH